MHNKDVVGPWYIAGHVATVNFISKFTKLELKGKDVTMATGETRWSSEGQNVKRVSFEPIPTGVYTLELKDGPRIGKANRDDAFPYVKCAFIAHGTGKDGGNDRWVFHSIFLSLTPGKDGELMMNRGGQLTELSQALGDMCEAGVLTLKDKTGKVVGKYLDPKDVQAWLEGHAGNVINGKVYVEKQKGYDDQNKIEFFEPANNDDTSDEEADEEPAPVKNGKKPLPKKK